MKPGKTCRQVQRLLLSHPLEEWSPANYRRLRTHCSGCSDCTHFLDLNLATERALQSLRSPIGTVEHPTQIVDTLINASHWLTPEDLDDPLLREKLGLRPRPRPQPYSKTTLLIASLFLAALLTGISGMIQRSWLQVEGLDASQAEGGNRESHPVDQTSGPPGPAEQNSHDQRVPLRSFAPEVTDGLKSRPLPELSETLKSAAEAVLSALLVAVEPHLAASSMEVRSVLLELALDPDRIESQRSQAWDSLGVLPPSAEIPVFDRTQIIDCLQGRDRTARRKVCRYLRQFEDPHGWLGTVYVELVPKEGDEEVLSSMLRSTCMARLSVLAPEIEVRARNPQLRPRTRLSALQALCEFRNVDTLVLGFLEEDGLELAKGLFPLIYEGALGSRTSLQPSRLSVWEPYLFTAPDRRVRERAFRALLHLGWSKATSLLSRFLRSHPADRVVSILSKETEALEKLPELRGEIDLLLHRPVTVTSTTELKNRCRILHALGDDRALEILEALRSMPGLSEDLWARATIGRSRIWADLNRNDRLPIPDLERLARGVQSEVESEALSILHDLRKLPSHHFKRDRILMDALLEACERAPLRASTLFGTIRILARPSRQASLSLDQEPRALEIIGDASDHENWFVRLASALAMASWGLEDSAEKLRAELTSSERSARFRREVFPRLSSKGSLSPTTEASELQAALQGFLDDTDLRIAPLQEAATVERADQQPSTSPEKTESTRNQEKLSWAWRNYQAIRRETGKSPDPSLSPTRMSEPSPGIQNRSGETWGRSTDPTRLAAAVRICLGEVGTSGASGEENASLPREE